MSHSAATEAETNHRCAHPRFSRSTPNIRSVHLEREALTSRVWGYGGAIRGLVLLTEHAHRIATFKMRT
jgi:hypothetical protein